MYFKIPEGLQIPEGTQEGDTFDALATFSLEKGGELCLRKIDDVSVDSGDETGQKQDKGYAESDAYKQAKKQAETPMAPDHEGNMMRG